MFWVISQKLSDASDIKIKHICVLLWLKKKECRISSLKSGGVL